MKKKVNILLLLLVVALWVTVIYKFAGHYFFKNNISNDNSDAVVFANIKIKEKDTFTIKQLNRDPFLNKLFSSSVEPKKYKPVAPSLSRTNSVEHNKKPISENLFPRVEYFGYIKSNNKQSELFLLKVNGKLLKMKLNEPIENLKISKNCGKDSIKLEYGKEVKYVHLKK